MNACNRLHGLVGLTIPCWCGLLVALAIRVEAAVAQDVALPAGAVTQIVHVAHASPVVAFLPDNSLATVERETIHIWDSKTGKPLRHLRWVKEAEHPLFAFSPDAKTVAILERGHNVHLFDVKSGAEKRVLLHANPVTALAFSSDGRLLATATSERSIRIWELSSGNEKQHFREAHEWISIFYLAFAPDNKTLVSASRDRTAAIWDVTRGRRRFQIGRYIPDKSGAPVFSAAALSPNGKTLATYFGGGDATGLRLWDLDTGKQRSRLTPYTDPIRGIVFSPDGKTLVVADINDEDKDHREGQVSFIELSTGKRRMTLRGQEQLLMVPMAFSANGRLLATAGKDQSIVIWDASGDK